MNSLLRACLLLSLELLFLMGCSETRTLSVLDSQLIAISNSKNGILRSEGVDSAVRDELKKSQLLLRYTAVSVRRGFGNNREKTFQFEDFEGYKLKDGITGVHFIYLFVNDAEFVLISDFFVPHIENFAPLRTLETTQGFYILHIRKSAELAKNVQDEFNHLGAPSPRAKGDSPELDDSMRILEARGVSIQGTSFDGARIDMIETGNYTAPRWTYIVVNPRRPLDSQEQYVDENIRVVDAVFKLLWEYFM